ncbi:MAG: toll/interleukin-1 receptor domain-containing protein [Candidatus Methanoperedens sp.]|nr:toll/interleukin-1 receptor domain-containing protein [Candidatus Methanoperedens sp.]
MAKVFIAYSGKNMRTVIDFSNKLQETDHKVFVASRDIEGGKQWREEIQNRINSIDVFVPLISQEFLNSDEAKRELIHAVDMADRNKIKVMSVLIDDLPIEVIPYHIKDRQYIPYQTFEVQVEKLLLELNPQDAYLSSKEAFERHINSRNFTSEELLLLGQHALQTLWAEQNEGMGLIIGRLFNLLRDRKEKEKVLIL